MSDYNPASRWNPADYIANASFVPALGAQVLALLDPQPGEEILDLGCGDGALTRKLVAAGARVVGIDASGDMVAAAKARGLDARIGDGQHMNFRSEFDAVFSNAALHWMLDPPAVAASVFEALKPGGRFVGEMGGEGNIATLRAGLRAELGARGYPVPNYDPQWYPSPDAFTSVYRAAGFVDIHAELIPRPTPLPDGITGWLRVFRSGFMDTAKVPDMEQPAIAEAVERRLAPQLQQPDGSWLADYVRLRFTMKKPA